MATILSKHVASERSLHFAVWGAQTLLACFFAAMAVLKLLLHHDRLIEIMPWAANLPQYQIRTLGALELVAAMVVAAPAVTRALQRVVGWTAVGFGALMIVSAAVHIARGELRMIPVSLAVAALAAFVAWGRLTHNPLEPHD
jgi:hypothetical protein